MSNLFIAVATGQNVANIPPILGIGKARDSVLWILSPKAKEARYHEGASKVLQKRGFKILPSIDVSDINNPRDIILKAPEIKKISANYGHAYVVLNGGQKLTPIPLLAMSRGKDAIPRATFLYGQAQPAELWAINPDNFEISVISYDKEKALTLTEFLSINNYSIQDTESAFMFWKSGNGITPAPPSKHKYPNRFEDINRLHSLHFIASKLPDGKFPRLSFDIWKMVAEKKIFERWKNSALSFLKKNIHINSEEALLKSFENLHDLSIEMWMIKEMMPEYARIDHSKHILPAIKNALKTIASLGDKHALRSLYKGLGNAYESVIKDHFRSMYGICSPDSILGPAFESAVRERVSAWLKKNDEMIPITEAWSNVCIGKNKIPEAEIDIGLLLSNGVLIHLECKAANAPVKELDARLANLHEAFSQLSELYLVSPAYTQAANEEWFIHIENNVWKKLENSKKVKLMKFTLPGQPRTYTRQNNAVSAEYSLEIPPFEDYLNAMISSYLSQKGEK